MAQFDRQISKSISRLTKSGALGMQQVRAAIVIEDAVVSILINDIHSGVTDQWCGQCDFSQNSFETALLESCASRQAYYDWVVAMKREGLPAGPVLDVIIDGVPLTTIDKRRVKRKGWTREKLKKALDLYIAAEELNTPEVNRLTA